MTIAITEYFTPFKRKITGICTQWLFNAPIGEVVPLWVRRGTLPYPQDLSIPVICVGPGTGVAPHLSFLEERGIHIEQKNINTEQSEAKTCLIFGNRNKDKDYIHQDKMEKWDKDQK